MADELLKQNLYRALDPGPDFPDRLLLSRSMASLDSRDSSGPRVSRRALVLIASILVIAIVATLVATRALHFAATTPAGHVPVLPLHHNGKLVLGGPVGLIAIDPSTGQRSTILPTATDHGISDAAYSPDGTELAYLAGMSNLGGGEIWVLDVASSRSTLLTNCSCPRSSHVAWSPDGSRLAYTDGDQLYLIEVATSHKMQLTHLGPGHSPMQPSWSPDGSQIVFTIDRNNLDAIKPDGSGLVVLLTDVNGTSDPAWSPDGSRIAYVLDPQGPPGTPGAGFDFQLWVMDPGGSHRALIFDNLGCCVTGWGGPAWSPDGTQIAVVAGPVPHFHLWVLNADGSNPRNLGQVDRFDRPTWQPVP